MPNWCFNTIRMEGIGTLDELYSVNSEGNKDFNFNALIPMPDELKDTLSGGRIAECVILYILETSKNFSEFKTRLVSECKGMMYLGNSYHRCKSLKEAEKELLKDIGSNPCMYNSELFEDHPEHTPYEIGEFYYNLKQKFGFLDWYGWSCFNWGTKWNACDTVIVDNDTIRFDTAWSFPEPIIYALSKRYPNSIISLYSEYEEGETYEAEIKDGEVLSEEWGHIEYEEGETA